jgi:uncharacterized protein (TIGR02117 family)
MHTRWMRIAKGILAALTLLAFIPPLLYALAAGVLGQIPQHNGFVSVENGIPVHVMSNGVHTDIVLPVRTQVIDWSLEFPPADFRYLPEPTSHISFGWGDRGFYFDTPYWSDLRFSTAFVALTGLGRAVMHVEYGYEPLPGADVAQVRLPAAQYCALVQHIRAAFERDTKGALLHYPGRGYFDTDAFYAARGRFSLFATCNDWVRKILAATCIRTPLWSPFSGPLLSQLRAARWSGNFRRLSP